MSQEHEGFGQVYTGLLLASALKWIQELLSTHPAESLNNSDRVSEKDCYGEGYL